MTFTFRFTLPYSGIASERLDAAQQTAAANASSESDLSGFTGSERRIVGHTVEWTLHGLDPADLSAQTRQEFQDAIQAEVPGASDFEIV